MWFKNLRAYRLTQAFDLPAEELDQRLRGHAFTPCGKSQAQSLGWVAPLGEQTEALVHAAGGRYLLRLKREEKLLPSTVVRELLEEKVAHIETEEARKVYRKERLNLKDEIIQDCLPRAFTRSSGVYAFIDTRAHWCLVDTASATRAEELLSLLRDCLGSFPAVLPQVNKSPAAVMTDWLVHRNLPNDFALGEECELREPGEEGGVVRCRGVDLLSEEVESHLQAGKQVVKLTLDWEERLSLVLGEDLCLRRLRFAEALVSENDDFPDDDPAARLDADFALMSSALVELQQRLLVLFGGESGEHGLG